MGFEPNDMMLELFRSEVESHAEALTSSLLALEHDPTAATNLERMMRAAHSIKGAARIVRINPAVHVAHIMEDCFVAAQKGKLLLVPDDVDVLLRGVDLLAKISAATKDSQTDWTMFDAPVRELVITLQGILDRPHAVTASPAVITCPAILDAGAAEQARLAMVSALAGGAREIQIDLSATQDLDAVGLAFLAAARRHVAAQAGTTIRFQPVSAELQTVLQLTGLDVREVGAAAQ